MKNSMSDARRECADAVGRLAAWAVDFPAAAIPREVLQRAVQVLVDDLAAIVGARDEPELRAFHERTISRATSTEATVFRGGRPRTDCLSAAVANAVAADWIELDEGYRPVSCHAGLYVIPALLAEGEARNLRVEEMLRALVLSYEITTRLARAWKPKEPTIQPHGRFAAIGSAAGIGLVRGVDQTVFSAALGTAVTLSGLSPRTHLAEGTLSRNVWPAAGAWAGMMSVEWAECGIGGALTAFHDAFSSLLGGSASPLLLTSQLGEEWAILHGYTKIYACCQHLHSAIEAVLALRAEVLAPARLVPVASIEIATHDLALPLADAQPRTTLGAKFSMPHAVAAALMLGSGGADAFAQGALDHPPLRELRSRVRMVPFTPVRAPPHDRPARVTIRLEDGRTFVGECLSALGGPDRPLPADTVFSKADALAGPVYPALRGVLESLAVPTPANLDRGWADVVREICEG